MIEACLKGHDLHNAETRRLGMLLRGGLLLDPQCSSQLALQACLPGAGWHNFSVKCSGQVVDDPPCSRPAVRLKRLTGFLTSV